MLDQTNNLNGAQRINDTHAPTSPAENLPAERKEVLIPKGRSRPQARLNGVAHRPHDIQELPSRAVPSIPAQPIKTAHPMHRSGGQETFCRAQTIGDTQSMSSPANLSDDRAHAEIDTQIELSPIVAQVVQLYRLRRRLLLAETKLVLQGQALCRMWANGDKKKAKALWKRAQKGKCEPDLQITLRTYLAAVELFQQERRPMDKQLEKLAKQSELFKLLPKGFGAGNLAALIGECGEISSYRNPSCLWKRMGLAVIDGKRQRKVADADEAIQHGYTPRRRALAYVIGDCLIKSKGPMKALYDERKAKKIAEGWTKLHAHRDAKMFMTKRVLRDLWIAAQPKASAQPISPAGEPRSIPAVTAQPRLAAQPRRGVGGR